MTELNAFSFKSPITNASANSIDAIKIYRVKVNYAHIVDLVINLFNSWLKRQSEKFVKRLVTTQKVVEVNTEK